MNPITDVGQRMTNYISTAESNHREMNEVTYQTIKFVSMVQQIEHFSISVLSTLIRQTEVVYKIVRKVQTIFQILSQLTQEKLFFMCTL